MQEDELIFLGAAMLLAPALPTKKSADPENDIEIQAAVAYAHFLYEEVKRRRQKIRDAHNSGAR